MWTLKTIEADVAEIGTALDDAVATYKADAGDSVAHRAVDAAASFAKALVAEGVFGDRVQVAVAGHANATPSSDGTVAPDQVSVQVRAVPPVAPPADVADPSTVGDKEESGSPGRASRRARSAGAE